MLRNCCCCCRHRRRRRRSRIRRGRPRHLGRLRCRRRISNRIYNDCISKLDM